MIAPWLVHPEWGVALAALWLALACAVALAVLVARRRAVRLLSAAPAGSAGWRRDAVLLLAALTIGLALLGPRLGHREQRIPASGVDVVVLLDVSRSMDARDVPPSRLDRARRTAEELLAGLAAGDRAALAVFGSRGVLLTPLTHDPDALLELLPALDSDLVQPAGSRLGAGVREALGAFDPASERARVLVVLSDGEDPDATGDLGRAEALRAGARVVAVAFGNETGATIPNQGLELRDRRGRVVLSRRDTRTLDALATATDGVSFAADARFGSVAAADVLSAVRRDAARAEGSSDGRVLRRVPAVRVVPLALLAIVLLLGESLAGDGRRLRIRGRRAAGAAAGIALFSIAAQGAPPDATALFQRAAALAAIEDWPAAERAFLAAALSERDPRRAADAYHDAGVAALRGGRLEAARDAFFEAVALAPERGDSRFNLEWTLRALSAEDPPPPPPSAEPEGREGSNAPETEPDTAPEAPRPARADPLPRPPGEPGSDAARSPAAPPPLDPAEVERLLSQAKDDPTRALRGLEGGDPRLRISPW